MNKIKASVWLVGYFVVVSPLTYALNGSLIGGLVWGSIGVAGAILILKNRGRR